MGAGVLNHDFDGRLVDLGDTFAIADCAFSSVPVLSSSGILKFHG